MLLTRYILFFCLFIIFIFIQSGYSQLPRFLNEKIEITIGDQSCKIKGLYYFRNIKTSILKRTLYYPFVIDSCLVYPDTIKVLNHQNNENTSFVNTKSGIHFPIEIPPGKTVLYEVYYTQKILANKMEYILTTTQKWGKPLEKAEFIVNLPSKFELKFLSYEYDEKKEINNYYIYEIYKNNFMPKKNLIVEWARRSR